MTTKFIEPKLGVEIPYKPTTNRKPQVKEILHENIKFYTVTMSANPPVRGTVLILHGWCEHTTMYYRIMDFLSNLGYECIVFDQRGAGRTSLGKYRGRCGRSLDVMLKDIDKMIEVFGATKGNNPFYVLGHLAGGALGLDYMINGKYRHEISGVIVTGPMIRIAEPLSPPPYIEYILSMVGGWFPYIPWGSINRDPNVRSTITTASQWLDYLQNELLTQGNCTLGQIKNIFDRGFKLASTSADEIGEKVNPNIRILTIHCVNDTMTSFEQLKKFFDKLPISNKEFVNFNKGNHSLFIETDEIFNETCNYISKFLTEE